MKVKDLIEELKEFDEEIEIGGVIVSYTVHTCREKEGSYCYCSSEDHEYPTIYIDVQKKKHKNKSDTIEKIWIRGDF